jgi:Na+-driven multidrug efflux pump
MIARYHGERNETAKRETVNHALFLSLVTGIIGTILLTVFPSALLHHLVLAKDSAVHGFATKYLRVRGMSVCAALIATTGFAIFRGVLDVVTPLKIAMISNLVNLALDPILIFGFKMGVVGAALASAVSDLIAMLCYLFSLSKRGLVEWQEVVTRGVPKFSQVASLLAAGSSVQLRSLALNAALLYVTRSAQGLDRLEGSVAAAHTISLQLFQLGSVSSLALGSVTAILVPSVLGKAQQLAMAQSTGNMNNNSSTASGNTANAVTKPIYPLLQAKQAADRLLVWGVIIGAALAVGQLLLLMPLIRLMTPLQDVSQIAQGPGYIGAALQWLNCIVWVAEGIQQSLGGFLSLAMSTVLGTMGMYLFIRFISLPSITSATISPSSALTRVWLGFVILAVVRLVCSLTHHFFTGPLAVHKIKAHIANINQKSSSTPSTIPA